MTSYSRGIIFGDYLDLIRCFGYGYTIITYDYHSGVVVKQFSQEFFLGPGHIVHICFGNGYCL